MRKSRFIFLFLIISATFVWAASEPQPTAKKKLTLQDILKATGQPASQPPTVQGVRGLEETNAGLDTKARNYPAIDKLDQVVIHEDDLKKFMAEGGLK